MGTNPTQLSSVNFLLKGAYFMCIFEVSFIHIKFMSSLRNGNIDINELGNAFNFVILLLK